MKLRKFIREFDPADPVRRFCLRTRHGFLTWLPAACAWPGVGGHARGLRLFARPAAPNRWLVMETNIQEPAGPPSACALR